MNFRPQLSVAACALAAVTLLTATALRAHGQDTVGNPLIDRPSRDGAVGSIFVLDQAISPGTLTDWGFYDNDFSGRDITPLLLQPNGGAYNIVGIGTTRSSDGSGAQTSAFGLVSGSDATGLGTLFGWKDGTNGADNAGVPEFTNAGPPQIKWFGGGQGAFSVGDNLGTPQSFNRTYSFQGTANNLTGETVGNGLFNRGSNDGAVGSIFVHNEAFTSPATLTDWAFYDNDSSGSQITPLLLTPNGPNWEITGVGTTRTSDASGTQTFAFDLLEGSDLVGADIYLGFKDGGDGTNNAGVADFDSIAGGANVIWLGGGQTSFDPGDTFGVAGSFDRTYSIQAVAFAPVPEPASIAVWALIGLAASAYFWRRNSPSFIRAIMSSTFSHAKVIVVAITLALACVACHYAEAQIITPTTVTANETDFGAPGNLSNASGLFGGGGELAQLHEANTFVAGNIWLADNNTGGGLPGGTLTFTLPGPSTIDGAHIWQYGQQPCCTARGVSVFDISFSTNGGVTFPTTISGLTLNQHDDRFDEARQTVTFAQQTGVTHVRFTAMDDFPSGGAPGFIGLGEVRFDSNAAVTLSNVTATVADITTVNDISQNGTLEYAFNTGGGPTINVAGIDFVAAAPNAPLGSQFTGANPLNATDDANFNTLLNTESFGIGNSLLELSGLTVGDDYELQLLMTDNRTCCSGRTVDINADGLLVTTAAIGVPQSVLLEFTAFDDTFNVQFFGTSGDPSYLGGFQLRNVTVPEPASALLWIVIGAAAIGFGYHKFRKT